MSGIRRALSESTNSRDAGRISLEDGAVVVVGDIVGVVILPDSAIMLGSDKGWMRLRCVEMMESLVEEYSPSGDERCVEMMESLAEEYSPSGDE